MSTAVGHHGRAEHAAYAVTGARRPPIPRRGGRGARIARLRSRGATPDPAHGGQGGEVEIDIDAVLESGQSAARGEGAFVFSSDDTIGSAELVADWMDTHFSDKIPPMDEAGKERARRRRDEHAAQAAAQAHAMSSYTADAGFQEIDVVSLREELERSPDAIVVDVRDRAAWNAHHIKGSVNVPWSAFAREELERFRVPSRPVYIVCAAGRVSAQATVRMSKVFGFENVSNVLGGMDAWRNAAFPVSRILEGFDRELDL